MQKKWAVVIFFAVLLLFVTATPAFAEDSWDGNAVEWTKGTGTADDPYLIETAEHLAFLAKKVNEQTYNRPDGYSGKHFKLMADLDLSGHKWMPIGYELIQNNGIDPETSVTPFRGTFDGNHHKVSGLNDVVQSEKVHSTNEPISIGLFGLVSNGSIQNLTVTNSTLNTNTPIAGVICGALFKGSITNCYVDDTVSLTNYYGRSGGICGYVDYSSPASVITGCVNEASITDSYMAGGIGGDICAVVISECVNTGDVSKASRAGGIGGSVTRATIEKCYNTGSITGPQYVGGIVGSISYTAKINNTYNTGSVTRSPSTSGDSFTGTGGIVGQLGYEGNDEKNSSYITNCHNYGAVSSDVYAGGVIGRANYYTQTVSNCYYLEGTAVSGNQNGIGAVRDQITADITGITEKRSRQEFGNETVTTLLQSANTPNAVWSQTQNNKTYPYPILVGVNNAAAQPTFTITIENGTADVTEAAAGATVTITATVPQGYVFDSWTVQSGSVTLSNFKAASTTFTMPASNVKIKANGVQLHSHALSSGQADLLWTAWNGIGSMPTSGNIYLTGNAQPASTLSVPENSTVNLCLNGFSIISSTSDPDPALYVSGTLNLCDCKATGSITHQEGKNGPGVGVTSTGTLNMYSGTITGNIRPSGDGNGVWLSGTMNMYGGSITDNGLATSSSYGGGVAMQTGGVLNMYGGSITNNTAERGGGVAVHQGTLNLYGGSITNNTADWGAGIYLSHSGNVNLKTCTINGNQNKSNADSDIYIGTNSNSQPIQLLLMDGFSGDSYGFSTEKKPAVGSPVRFLKRENASVSVADLASFTCEDTTSYGMDTDSEGYGILKLPDVSVDEPVAKTDLEYTGSELTGVTEGTGYTLTGHKATDAGSYTATATLATGYKWSDGTTEDKHIAWEIGKVDGPAAPTGLTTTAPTTYGGSDGIISGVNSTMEWSSDDVTYQPCTDGSITDLKAGTYYVRFKETENAKAGIPATLVINEPAGTAPVISTASLPNGMVGTAYSQQLQASGTSPIEWSLADGSALPAGLFISKEGIISGTPAAAGTTSFTVQARNAIGEAEIALTMTVDPVPVVPQVITVEVAPSHTIIQGKASITTLTIGKGLPDLSANNFASLTVDGQRIQRGSETFEVYTGSVIIQLHPAYLNTLHVGEHHVVIELQGGVYDGYSVETSLTVIPETGINASSMPPKTGDSSHLIAWSMTMLIALFGVVSLIGKRKRA